MFNWIKRLISRQPADVTPAFTEAEKADIQRLEAARDAAWEHARIKALPQNQPAEWVKS